jgi:hypothetical protein
MMTLFRAVKLSCRPVIAAGSVIGLLLGGCATRGNVEALESQLRKREMVIQDFQRETVSLRNELKISRREMESMRKELALQGRGAPEELTHALARVEGLSFNSLLTAAQDHDQVPGDERFHAVFYPHDAHGEIVKIAGTIEVEAIDPSRPRDKSIGRWKYDVQEAPELWHAGFLSSGYQIDMPWQSSPQGSRVVLLARLTTSDGRKFESTRTLTVNPPPQGSQVSQSLPGPQDSGKILPANFDETAENRPVPNPEPWEFEKQPAPSQRPTTTEGAKEEFPSPSDPQQKPVRSDPQASRPFPTTATSDNWTDAAIPVLR